MNSNNRSDREHMSAADPTEDQPRWAQDFPIDVGRDNYVARRDFTKFMVLTSFAFVVGQLWIGFQNYRRRRSGKPPIKSIAQIEQLQVGSSMPFNYPDQHDPCLLIRRGENELIAFSQKCTHLSCAVLPDVKGNQFLCPCHEGCFEMSTGRPIAGPPRRPLEKITLSVRGNTIYATGVEEGAA